MDIELIHSHEKPYFVISVIVSVMVYLLLIISIIGIPYILFGIIISFFIHGLSIAHIRSNGVKVTDQQFPRIDQRVKELAQEMGLKSIPDVFILQSNGILNAFASKFFGRHFVVLYSEIVELIEQGNHDELDFIIAHELAHIKRNHLSKNILILPAMWLPFLGKAYSRACELTCDRFATVYTGNAKSSVNAIAIIAVGKALFDKINIADYLTQYKEEKGFFIWLSHTLSSHPPLPNRIQAIQRLSQFSESFGLTTEDLGTEHAG